MDIPEYKYDFDLSSKQKFFLYMYQKIPNIDIITHIYKLKEELEDEEVKIYHGLCPRNVKTIGSWIPKDISHNFKSIKLGEIMLMNALIIKLIILMMIKYELLICVTIATNGGGGAQENIKHLFDEVIFIIFPNKRNSFDTCNIHLFIVLYIITICIIFIIICI